jgi:hypothetical protein
MDNKALAVMLTVLLFGTLSVLLISVAHQSIDPSFDFYHVAQSDKSIDSISSLTSMQTSAEN